mmetsp:Transcript_104253/g.299785  ORF Transcript_104253/g.299785 Transcript_104253/m.299785 type:complete len:291 (+) Transcript_104253:1856-2728(+)
MRQGDALRRGQLLGGSGGGRRDEHARRHELLDNLHLSSGRGPLQRGNGSRLVQRVRPELSCAEAEILDIDRFDTQLNGLTKNPAGGLLQGSMRGAGDDSEDLEADVASGFALHSGHGSRHHVRQLGHVLLPEERGWRPVVELHADRPRLLREGHADIDLNRGRAALHLELQVLQPGLVRPAVRALHHGRERAEVGLAADLLDIHSMAIGQAHVPDADPKTLSDAGRRDGVVELGELEGVRHGGERHLLLRPCGIGRMGITTDLPHHVPPCVRHPEHDQVCTTGRRGRATR